MSHAWEILNKAVHCLAGTSSQRERLKEACVEMWVLRSEEVPERIRKDFVTIKNDVGRIRPEDEKGAIQATLDKMSDAEIDDTVDRIIHVYDALRDE